MVTVAQLIDSIEHLNANSKAALKRHVQMDEFGASLDADCDDLFKEALRENLPTTFNTLQRTAAKRVLQQPGASNEVLLALNEIKSLLQVHSALQLDRFMYTEGKLTRKTDPGAQLFSRSVKSDYGALQGSKCWCLLTNAVLPSSTVIGSHLFKWEWSEYVHLLGFDNINDVKNGLPLWKPIEWAFDTSRLCFTFDKNSDKFIAKITDPSILLKKLVDIGRDKMGRDWRSPPYPLQNLTFQDIDNRALEFDPGRPLRPYKRVLNFQARQARTYAIRHGWQPASWNFEDYLIEGMELSEKLKIWYNSMH